MSFLSLRRYLHYLFTELEVGYGHSHLAGDWIVKATGSTEPLLKTRSSVVWNVWLRYQYSLKHGLDLCLVHLIWTGFLYLIKQNIG